MPADTSPQLKAAESRLETITKWRSISLLVACSVMVLSVWFSSAAVLPALAREFGLTATWGALATSAVALGFVVGTLGSAGLGLADRLEPRRFFMASCFVAAAANAGMVVVDPGGFATILLRFIAGASMAGVYPLGMKLASSWANGDRGLLIGLLVGAVTLGSAMPHLIGAILAGEWRATLLASSALAVLAGLAINFVQTGPSYTRAPAFHAR